MMGSSIIKQGGSGLKERFASVNPTAHGNKWDELWAQNFVPWDRGLPSPALIDLLESGQLGESIVVDHVKGSVRKRALVPGCGKGYDVLLLSAFGYDAYGLDVSDTALRAAREHEKTKIRETDYTVRDSTRGRGRITWIVGDFFKDEFLKEVEGDGTFELIYDYTFLSALPPELRPAWAQRYSQLLGPKGNLVCLEFPTYKDPELGGPPWALPPDVYMGHLQRPGQVLPYGNDGHILNDRLEQPAGNGLYRVAHFRPKRTHPVGLDEDGHVTDWISIWTHKADS